jgi:hypothetical protein
LQVLEIAAPSQVGAGNDMPIGHGFRGHHTNQACYKSGILSPNTSIVELKALS